MVECPIKNCGLKFDNRYGLTNHLRKSKDKSHSRYYDDNVAAKTCQKCGRRIDRRSLHQDVCWTCRQKVRTKRKIKKEILTRRCFLCGEDTTGLYSRRNTRVLCVSCSKRSVERKKRYNIAFDKERYQRAKEERLRIREQNRKKTESRLLSALYKEITNSDKPLHEICTSYHLSPKRVKDVAQSILSEKEYSERCWGFRHRAGVKVGELHKKRWQSKNRPNSKFFCRAPNGLETLLGSQIEKEFPGALVRYNVWKTLYDREKRHYLHLETDIAFYIDAVRVCVLCDGEAFHGAKSFFRGNTVDEDEHRSRVLFEHNPVVLRYSESEIKRGSAILDIKKRLEMISNGTVVKDYRNWMIPD